MSFSTFASIDIGSNEISMKLYEISKKYGIVELDSVRKTIELGVDTYNNKTIRHSLVNELCQILTGFKKKMKEYQITDYKACATSAIREASNRFQILDQIQQTTGFQVQVLSNSEQRFLLHKAVALKQPDFQEIITNATAIVDVGAGSIQLSMFDQQKLLTTNNIKLGSLRVRELVSHITCKTNNYSQLVSDYIDTHLKTFQSLFFSNETVYNIIGIGEILTSFLEKCYDNLMEEPFNTKNRMLSSSKFHVFYQRLLAYPMDTLAYQLGIPKEQTVLILPTAMIYEQMLSLTHASSVYFPEATLCDGMIADYVEREMKGAITHNYLEDIISSATFQAKRYFCNESHVQNVSSLALQLFDQLKKLHGLNKRNRMLLQVASILHSCGEFVNMNDVAENSYHIILSTEIIGLTHKERMMIALLARYQTNSLPDYSLISSELDSKEYIDLCKLATLLQIADTLDASHSQKISSLNLSIKEKELMIFVHTTKDITLEQGLIKLSASLFEDVYGLHPILKAKKEIHP